MKILLKYKNNFRLSMQTERDLILNTIQKSRNDYIFKEYISKLQVNNNDTEAVVQFTNFLEEIADKFTQERKVVNKVTKKKELTLEE